MRRAALLLPLLLTAAYDDDRGPGVPPQPRGAAMVYAVDGFDAVGLGTGATVAERVGPRWSVQAKPSARRQRTR